MYLAIIVAMKGPRNLELEIGIVAGRPVLLVSHWQERHPVGAFRMPLVSMPLPALFPLPSQHAFLRWTEGCFCTMHAMRVRAGQGGVM